MLQRMSILMIVVLGACACGGGGSPGASGADVTGDVTVAGAEVRGADGSAIGPDEGSSPPTPFAGACGDEFGPVVEVSPARVGQTVVLEGRLDGMSPVRVAPEACRGLGGLSSLVLKTGAAEPDNEYVRLRNAAGEMIFCGCPPAQDEECRDLPAGARVRVRGVLEDNPDRDPAAGCYQVPCFLLKPEASCLIGGCDEDAHCAEGTCATNARQCRAQPGAACVPEVGCDSPGDETIVCAEPDQAEPSCLPVGDGSEDAPCEDDADCDPGTCGDCICVGHVCAFVPWMN